MGEGFAAQAVEFGGADNVALGADAEEERIDQFGAQGCLIAGQNFRQWRDEPFLAAAPQHGARRFHRDGAQMRQNDIDRALGHPVTAVDIDLKGLGPLAEDAGVEAIQADLENGPWPLAGLTPAYILAKQ